MGELLHFSVKQEQVFTSLPSRAVERISVDCFTYIQNYVVIAECWFFFFMNMYERHWDVTSP